MHVLPNTLVCWNGYELLNPQSDGNQQLNMILESSVESSKLSTIIQSFECSPIGNLKEICRMRVKGCVRALACTKNTFAIARSHSVAFVSSKLLKTTESDEITDLQDLQFNNADVTVLEFSPFFRPLVATGTKNGKIFLCDIDSDSKSPIIEYSQSEEILAIRWNYSAANILSSVDAKGIVNVYDTRKEKSVFSFPTGQCWVDSDWRPNTTTQMLTVCNSKNGIALWDLRKYATPLRTFGETGAEKVRWSRKALPLIEFKGLNTDYGHSVADGDRYGVFATVSNSITSLWNMKTGKIAEYKSPLAVFSPNTPFLLALEDSEHNVCVKNIYDYRTEEIHTPPHWQLKSSGISFGFGGKCVVFSHDSINVVDLIERNRSHIFHEISFLFNDKTKIAGFIQKISSNDSLSSVLWRTLSEFYSKDSEVTKPLRKRLIDFILNIKCDCKFEEEDVLDDENVITVPIDNHPDRELCLCLLFGEWEKSVEIEMKNNNFSEALMLASCGGSLLWKTTQQKVMNIMCSREHATLQPINHSREIYMFMREIFNHFSKFMPSSVTGKAKENEKQSNQRENSGKFGSEKRMDSKTIELFRTFPFERMRSNEWRQRLALILSYYPQQEAVFVLQREVERFGRLASIAERENRTTDCEFCRLIASFVCLLAGDLENAINFWKLILSHEELTVITLLSKLAIPGARIGAQYEQVLLSYSQWLLEHGNSKVAANWLSLITRSNTHAWALHERISQKCSLFEKDNVKQKQEIQTPQSSEEQTNSQTLKTPEDKNAQETKLSSEPALVIISQQAKTTPNSAKHANNTKRNRSRSNSPIPLPSFLSQPNSGFSKSSYSKELEKNLYLFEHTDSSLTNTSMNISSANEYRLSQAQQSEYETSLAAFCGSLPELISKYKNTPQQALAEDGARRLADLRSLNLSDLSKGFLLEFFQAFHENNKQRMRHAITQLSNSDAAHELSMARVVGLKKISASFSQE